MTYKLDPWSKIVAINTYKVEPDTQLKNEGQSLTFTFTAPDPDDTTFYWKLVSVTGVINDNDFSYPTGAFSTGGSFQIYAGQGFVFLNIKNDLTTEGPEKLKMEIRKTSQSGQVVATSADVTIIDTSVGDSSIGVPGIPSGTLGAHDCRWNPTGTSVAWSHRINSNTPGTKCVSVYDFSGGALTKVADIVTAKYGWSLDWANSTTLAVIATGAGEVDRGLTVWTRSGNTFTKTYQNAGASISNVEAKLRYCPYGIQVGSTLYNTDTSYRISLGSGGENVSWSGSIAVVGSVGNSATVNPIKVYSYNSSTNTLTAETPFVPPKYPDNYGTMMYPGIVDLRFSGTKLLLGTWYAGYNPTALMYNRNGANSWTKLFEVPSDPEQTEQTGSGWGANCIDWKPSGDEFAIGRFQYVDTPSGVYRYSSGGGLTQKIASPGGQFRGLDYHPSQKFIAAASYNNQPYFRVYPF